MDLIRTDQNLTDIRVILDGKLDFESSKDVNKCEFQFETLIEDNSLELGDYVYVSNTEYGGRVDTQKIDTGKGIITSSGRTWRGILGSKIIEPLEGEDYYVLTGDLNENISGIITKCTLQEIFEVDDSETTSITYKFPRYINAYSGIINMLNDNGYKLNIIKHEGSPKVTLSAVPINDYSNSSEITSDFFDFIIEKKTAAVNHVIGLGGGELAERLVINKYIQSDGTIGDTQYYFGKDEITTVLDYPNAESLEDLEKSTIQRLKDEAVSNSLEISSSGDLNADMGDKFTAVDITTGTSITQYVTDKIVTIQNDVVKIDYEIGDQIK